jgi:hypothetical protein
MTNFILTLSLISFGVFFFSMLLTMRRLEIENKNLRKENTELLFNSIK